MPIRLVWQRPGRGRRCWSSSTCSTPRRASINWPAGYWKRRSPSSGDGGLRVNPMVREAMTEKSEEVSDEWARHIERASLFVKCMQQRNNTMRRLMELLTTEQREFILRGDRHLKPMTRARLAEKTGDLELSASA